MSISQRALNAHEVHIAAQKKLAADDMPAKDQPISEQFRLAAEEWADKDAAASLMEELKSMTLEKLKTDQLAAGPMADNTAQRLAKCHPDWEKYIRKMCKFRAEADKLRVQMEYLRMKHREWIGADATARAERRL